MAFDINSTITTDAGDSVSIVQILQTALGNMAGTPVQIRADTTVNVSAKIWRLAEWFLDTQRLVPGIGDGINPGGVNVARDDAVVVDGGNGLVGVRLCRGATGKSKSDKKQANYATNNT